MEKPVDAAEHEILDRICVCIGPFKIPKTVGDLGILLAQTEIPDNNAAHRVLLSEFAPYKKNIETLTAKHTEWAEAPHEHVIDPDTRYIASQVITFLAREIDIAQKERERETTQAVSKPTRSRFAAALQAMGVAF